MKSPYRSALSALQREMDELRAAIHETADRLVRIEHCRLQLSETIRREMQVKAEEWSHAAEGFFNRASAERARLALEGGVIAAQLEQLRRQARERYGSLRAMESADQSWHEERERRTAASEQAGMDDVVGARIASHRRARPPQRRNARIA